MKTNLWIMILLMATLSACGPSPEQQRKAISDLEATVGESPEQAAELLTMYDKYIANNPEDSDNGLSYDVRSSLLRLQLNQIEDGANQIKTIMDVYGEAGIAALMEGVQDLRKSMFNDETGRIDMPKANAFITAAEAIANLRPEDDKTPVILHQAGETARSVRNFDKAISIYDQIYMAYPDYEKAPQALFLKAFTMDNDLKRPEEARKLYQEFLERYPEDDFADDTQFLLENLGKDDEEIIKSFQEKEVQ
jgi:tetratricopeptide (TPR) repeat protein